MKLGLVASLTLLPPLLTTGSLQDIWFGLALAEWEHEDPWSYWISRVAGLVFLIWVWRRARRPV